MSLVITCPYCGPRDGYEFRYGGEDKGPPPAAEGLTREAWCAYVHENNCTPGVQKEWWCHKSGCGAWFTIYRDTLANREVEGPDIVASPPRP